MKNIPEILVAVLNSLWLAAAVAALIWLALKLLPRANLAVNAATRYVIWWATLFVVLVLPVAPRMIGLLRHRAQPAPTVGQVANQRPAASPPVELQPAIVTLQEERSARWPLWVAALWGAVLVFRSGQVVRSYFYLRGVKARATISPQPLPPIARRARLLLSEEIASPMAVGFSSPAVILPDTLPAELAPGELEHVLLHEAAHLARKDDWTNLAVRLLAAALALHPVALWILRQIDREREMACDDWVVAYTGEARPYAASLARMFERRWSRRRVLLASGLFGSGSRLGERIEVLLKRGREFSPNVSLKRVASSGLLLLGFVLVGALAPRWIAFAQQPAFEVASIKPNRSGQGVSSAHLTPGRIAMENVPVKKVTLMANDIPDDQQYRLAGPEWLSTERFDIQATFPADTAPPQVREMLRALLAERFKLRLHRETRQLPVYTLLVAKSGARIHAVEEGAGRTSRTPGRLQATKITMQKLADLLTQITGRPVVDGTRLKGVFDFTLEWAADGPDAAAQSDGPSLITAIQEQLGLRLESAKGPVEILVVDHAERPNAN